MYSVSSGEDDYESSDYDDTKDSDDDEVVILKYQPKNSGATIAIDGGDGGDGGGGDDGDDGDDDNDIGACVCLLASVLRFARSINSLLLAIHYSHNI